MSEASTVFRKFEIEADGKKWVLPRPTLAVEATYSTFLERKAAEALGRHRSVLGPVGYAEAMKQFTSTCVGNFYGWLRQGFVESLDSADNVSHLLMFWVNANHPEDGDPLNIADEKSAYMMYVKPENKAAWDRVVGEVLNDPNPLLP
jgi:hypothetical protein